MKKVFRKFGFLVIAAGFGRELGRVWQNKRLEYQSGKEQEGLLQQRRQYIETYLLEHDLVKLQIGSGGNPLPGWINTDLEPVSDQIIFMNALEVFPFEDQRVDYIFCEEMIEHINYREGLWMLGECFRIMKPGGRIRIATPDAEKIAGLYSRQKTHSQKQYLEWCARTGIGLYSIEKTEMKKWRPEWDIDPVHINKYFPDASKDSVCFVVNNLFRSYGHQFLYDARTLSAALSEAGFSDLSSHFPGESEDVHLRGLEAHQRFMGLENYWYETMVLEGIRPAPGAVSIL